MSIKKQVNRFWKVFESEQNNLEKAMLENNVEEIKEIKKILDVYFEELCNCTLELSLEDDIFEITFLPEQDKNAQIVCALLKKMAPKKISDKWLIHSSLPPMSQKALNTILRLKDQEYHANHFEVFYEVDEDNHCLDIAIYCDAFQLMEENKANEVGIYMLQLYLGEVALEAYINNIRVVVTREGSEHTLLTNFYEVLLDIVSEKKWTEYSDATSIYRVYKLKEEKISDEVRKDMKVIFTIHPLLIGEVLNDEYVMYHQFFDFGGEYGFLYYEHEKKEANDAYIRQTLEKSLNELLYPLGIARSIGGAIGTKYAYIDLAIFDMEEFITALPKINEKLSIKLRYQSFE